MEQNNNWVDDRLAKLNPQDEWKPQVSRALAQFESKRAQKKSGWPKVLSVAALAGVCVLMFPQPRAMAGRVVEPCVTACESLAQGDFDDHLHLLMWTVHNFLGFTPPNFQLVDAKGAQFRLSDYQGDVILLNFWATWCKPCQQEMPWFAEFEGKYGNKGFAVIGVSMDEAGWKAVRPVVAAQKIPYRVAVGDEALSKKYGGLSALPETLLINRQGMVVVRHSGVVTKDQYEREIRHSLHLDRVPD